MDGRLPARKVRSHWMLQLRPSERSTLLATFAGWMLDGMDVTIYSFVLPSLMILWHLTQGQAGLLGTSVLIVSSAGGWLAGWAADRFGRVRVLQLTIIWFAVFTCLSGFTNSFAQLLWVRGLQGLGFGGEWAVGSVLMSEAVASQRRGKAVGTVQSGWALGWGMAAAFFALFFTVLPAAWAWRAMFWLGILPALLIFYIRRHVPEPVLHAKLEENVRQERSFLDIFSRPLLRTTVLASVVALGAQGGYYAIMTWLPLYLKSARGLSVLSTTRYLAVIITGSFAGYLLSADWSDRFGRRRTLALFAVGSFLTVWVYTAWTVTNVWVLVLGFPLGFFSSGSFSPLGSFFAELFPTPVRGSGQGFCYNLGRGLGALFPALVGVLSSRLPLAQSIAAFSLAAYALMLAATFLLPETRGRELTA